MTDFTDWADQTGIFPASVATAKDDELISELQRRGYLAHKPQPATHVADHDLQGDRIRFGVVSDTHFGSKFQQPTLLVEHLRYMRKRKVHAILLPGDVTDGSTQMHPGFEYELWSHGADAQVEAAANVLIPEADRMKIPWYLIGGNHDASHFKQGGTDVVARLCELSEWFHYLTPDRDGNARGSVGNVRFGKLLVQLCHPHMGSAYALSYRMQKWIEALSPENKPHLVVMGNFHKVLQMDYRNVFGLMVPAFQSQSAWMASKMIASHVGSGILEVGVEPKGMTPSVQMEWLLERVPNQGDWPGGGD